MMYAGLIAFPAPGLPRQFSGSNRGGGGEPWPVLRVERGVQSQRFTPLRLAGGWGDRVYGCLCQTKCTMQSQKQWHFLSLTMVALFSKLTHCVPLFTFQLELPRGKIYNLILI